MEKIINLSNNRKLKIIRERDPESPREWDNNGLMVCFHSEYNLGDKHKFGSPQEFRDWMEEQGDDIIACLPLYLYEHSDMTISTKPFSCSLESGQVGWIIATRDTLESGGHNVDDLEIKKVEIWLRGEVETYDQFLRGDVYGFELYDDPCPTCGHKGEVTDSCWGFYGDDPIENGMNDHLDCDLLVDSILT